MNCLPVIFLCNTIRGKKGRFHNLNFQIAQKKYGKFLFVQWR